MDTMMAYRLFTLPINDPGEAENELNGFLATHRVLSVDRRFVEEGERSFWSFCVDFIDQQAKARLFMMVRVSGGIRTSSRPSSLSTRMCGLGSCVREDAPWEFLSSSSRSLVTGIA
jgi:hypothetical protein